MTTYASWANPIEAHFWPLLQFAIANGAGEFRFSLRQARSATEILSMESEERWYEVSDVGRLNNQSAVRSLELGDARLTYVVDGAMELTTRGFFPQVPDSYWSTYPETVNSHGRVAMSVGGLLVEREGKRLLIDAGLGNVVGEVAVGGKYIGVANSGALPDVLAALDRSYASIDVVAFTHLHVDHTGWAFDSGPDGMPRKFFRRAQYFVAAQEWVPHARGELVPGAPPRSTVIEPLAELHTPITDGQEVFPGVRALITPGHSPGHTSYVISSAVGRVIVFGDAFHLPAQLSHPEWGSLPDIDGASVLAARRRLLGELTQPSTLAFAYHFGDQPFGCVVPDETGAFSWSPVPTTVLMKTPRALAER